MKLKGPNHDKHKPTKKNIQLLIQANFVLIHGELSAKPAWRCSYGVLEFVSGNHILYRPQTDEVNVQSQCFIKRMDDTSLS